MRFENDILLWLILVVPPALLAFFMWAWRRRERLLGQFIEPRLLAGLTAGISRPRRKWKLALLVGAVGLLLLSLARPQWGFHLEETRQRGLDVIIAIDTSKSMLAEDISPNRLARAKLAALDLMQQAKSDRLGLVAFAGSAFLMCPLTIDEGAFRHCVETLSVDIIPQGGTALAEAIETARTAFKQGSEGHRVLVLFTDGEDHDEGAVRAAEEAAKDGLRIFTIGIGTPDGEMVRLRDAKGRTDFVRDTDGNVVKSKLNQDLLQEVALKGNGFYLPLRGADTVDKLYADGLAPLPKAESEARVVKRFHERYHWPLGLAIALLLTEMFLPERRRSPKGNSTRSATRTTAAPLTAALLLGLLGGSDAQASITSARKAYQAGRFEDARKEYEALLLRRAEDPRLHFNAGAAAYRDGQFTDAIERFAKATAAQDLKLQQFAYYNRGNARYQVGERESEMDKKRQSWEQAVQDYEATLKLDPKDDNAKHNLEFVKRRLEELKQQEQQQQDKKDQQEQKDQQDQKDQQKDQPQKQDQQNKDQKDQQQPQDQQEKQQQDQQQQKSGQDQKDQQRKQQEQKEKERQEKERQEQEKQQQQAKQQQNKDSKDQPSDEEQEQEAGTPTQAGMLTPQQARQILDALQSNEKLLQLRLQERQAKPTPPRQFKDW